MSKDKKCKNILVVEDDKFISKAFKDSLTRAGFVVKNAYDGEEALKMIYSDQPDIILLDLLMPKKDGFAVLGKIRNDEKIKNIPVIIVTNVEDKESIKRANELKADEYLLKANITTEEVTAKIKKHCKGLNKAEITYQI